jgi:hypothetical protein
MDKKKDKYNSNKEYKLFHDNRKDRDFWVVYIKAIGILNWLLIVDSWFPKNETFFDRLFNISRNDFWKMDITPLLVFLVGTMFVCSSIALIANTRRLKRDIDSFNLSNLMGFIVSWLAIIAYFSI